MAKKSKSRERKPAGRPATVDVTRRICNLVPSRGTDKDWTFRDSVAGGAICAVVPPPPPSTYAGPGGPSTTRKTPAPASAGRQPTASSATTW